MATVREMFHELGNWHNKISVGAGVGKQILKSKFKKNPLPAETEDIMKCLVELEQFAISADKTLIRIRDFVYERIDPDTGKPR